MSSATRKASRRRSRDTGQNRFQRFFASEQNRFWIFCGFVIAVFMMGGGSRGDIWSLAALRPLSVLAIGFALILHPSLTKVRLSFPGWLVLALAGLMMLQLIPMPQSMWSALPEREFLVKFGADAGVGEVWRPITLSPSRTWQSLFSLTVPVATFLLISALPSAMRTRLIWPLFAAGALSALLALGQIIGPTNSALYTYRITNNGAAVGLFANRNHNAIFLASLIPLVGYFVLRAKASAATSSLTIAAAVGGVLFIVPMILVTGSRAGVIFLMLALLATGGLLLFYTARSKKSNSHKPNIWRRAALPAMGIATVLVIYASYSLSRSRGLERLFEASLDADLRFKVLPAIIEMAQAYLPFGSGYGTFDLAYKSVETADVLNTSYLNHAHNDPLQFVLEGGVPGAIILAVAAVWLGKTAINVIRTLIITRSSTWLTASVTQPTIDAFALVSLATLLAGGLLDYPLRTPALMCAASILAAILSMSRDRTPADA